MPPRVLSKHNDRPSGVLPIPGAARAAATKAPAARLKLEIRRLPPGLTLSEFEEILGPEWKLGDGKVDWREYRQGKMKMALGKVPEQSRCYLHLTSEALVKEFEARFLQVVFHDKAGTHRSPDLRHLPPTVGFAPNQRTPLTAKPKADPRQGTIDQDPEFIRFLEAETQPIIKPAALDAVGVEREKAEKIELTSTPLIEAIREKKANKAKAAAAKEEKREAKGHAKGEGKDTSAAEKGGKDGKATKQTKGEQSTKDSAKAVNKQAANKQQQQPPASTQQAQPKSQATPAKSKKSVQKNQTADAASASDGMSATPALDAATTSQRVQRPRGNPESLKKLIQKDLGIKPNASAPAQESASQASANPRASAAGAASAKPSAGKSQTPTVSAKSQPHAKVSAAPKQQAKPAAVAPAHRAFLKHASANQGVTDDLIKQALQSHGEVSSVSFDAKKSTAVAVFRDADGLKKALQAKRIPVAEGTIEVLEYRDRSASSKAGPTKSGGRGGSRGGKGNSQTAASVAPAPAAAAPVDTSK